jgi:two-component system OmpR family response regulator
MTETKTILVVDDNQELREGLTAVLGRQGYSTLAADDGWLARQLITQQRPDLVILDMMMPRWGGLAVLEHFRGKAGAPRFIVISAEGERHKSYVEELGAVDYISKPFSMGRLLEGVGKVVPAPAPAPAQKPAPKEADAVIRSRCPACGSRIKAPKQLLGQRRPCPGCGRAFMLALPQEDEGVMLVTDNV